ncbi:MAG: HAD family hydrolase [Clostridia bacterium]|nr:HAD family hydrolase [Clostridia bacterium]
MIKAVLFDLDGTLVNSLCDLATSCNFALESFGFPTHETEKYKYFVGNGMPSLIERILPEDKRDSDTHKKVFDVFYNHYSQHFADKTAPYEGICELLCGLKQKGLKIGIISNKKHEMTLEVVNKLFDVSVFDVIYGKMEGYPVKPDVKLTFKLMEELGVKPDECVLAGDSGMDMAASVNAGCKGIGVLWGFRGKEELLENGADYIVEKPCEILKIIEEI